MITALAPGKILLLGGYAVLERPNVAYVLAVNKYVEAVLRRLPTNEIIIDMPNFGLSLNGDWSRFAGSLDGHEKARFVIHAISTCAKYLDYKKIHRKGFELRTTSDEAFMVNSGKSGLGSSAAVTVATVAAVLGYHGIRDIKIIHRIAQFSHAQAQGKIGSGFDIASACYGSIEYVRYSPDCMSPDFAYNINLFGKQIEDEWDYKIEKIRIPEGLQLVMANFPGTGASTPNMVRGLHEWMGKNPDRYREIMRSIDTADRLAIKALQMNHLDIFKKHFTSARLETKKLGEESGIEIESNEHSRLIEASMRHGAFVCRLPGAGGGDAIVALALDKTDKKRLEAFWRSCGLHILDVAAIAGGCRYVQ